MCSRTSIVAAAALAAAAVAATVTAGGTADAAPASKTGYQVVTADLPITSSYNPATGEQTTATLDCPAGKVPISGGGTATTSMFTPYYLDNPIGTVVDSRPTAAGWTLTWLPANSNVSSGGNPALITAHLSLVCATP